MTYEIESIHQFYQYWNRRKYRHPELTEKDRRNAQLAWNASWLWFDHIRPKPAEPKKGDEMK